MPKLNVDFSLLHEVVAKIATEQKSFEISISVTPIEPIDIELNRGIEVQLKDIDCQAGLLSHQGRQVLLYIKDQGRYVQQAINGNGGYRFHVADCETLKGMRENGRYNRYVVTNSLTGLFPVCGHDNMTGEKIEGEAELKVCKNCLKKLNYKGYNVGGRKREIFENFSMDEFFKTYSSHFKYLPRYTEDDAVDYPDDWPSISGRIRAERNFTCENCGVNLAEHKHLLHAHHKNGVKQDNRDENLVVLCADCHRKQDLHDHLFVSAQDMQIISSLRREQAIGAKGDWGQALMLADPAVEGLLLMCRGAGLPVPAVGYELVGNDGAVEAELELAWPHKRVGVAISEDSLERGRAAGWSVWLPVQALDAFYNFQKLVLSSF